MALPTFELEERMAESNYAILPLTMVHRYYATEEHAPDLARGYHT
jgi:hypothetical protein